MFVLLSMIYYDAWYCGKLSSFISDRCITLKVLCSFILQIHGPGAYDNRSPSSGHNSGLDSRHVSESGLFARQVSYKEVVFVYSIHLHFVALFLGFSTF